MDMGGAPPHTDTLIGPATFGDVQKNGLFKTTRVRRAFFLLLALWLSWTWLEHLWNSAKLRPPTRAPVRWTLALKTNHLWSLRLCQSRNGTTNSTIAEESFPGDVTQPSQVSTREQPKEHEPTTWNPKQRTHAGKRNQLRACFKPIQASTNWIPNPD